MDSSVNVIKFLSNCIIPQSSLLNTSLFFSSYKREQLRKNELEEGG